MKVYLQSPNRPKTRRLIGIVSDRLETDWRPVAHAMDIPVERLAGGRRIRRNGELAFILVALY
jgi:hypothetical protein